MSETSLELSDISRALYLRLARVSVGRFKHSRSRSEPIGETLERWGYFPQRNTHFSILSKLESGHQSARVRARPRLPDSKFSKCTHGVSLVAKPTNARFDFGPFLFFPFFPSFFLFFSFPFRLDAVRFLGHSGQPALKNCASVLGLAFEFWKRSPFWDLGVEFWFQELFRLSRCISEPRWLRCERCATRSNGRTTKRRRLAASAT